MSKNSYEKADRVITISSEMKEEISRNVNKDKIEIIYPWVDTSFITPLKKEDNWFVKKHGLSGKKIILYSGNMGITHDLLTPLKVAKNIEKSNPEYHFLLIGDGVQKQSLINYASYNKLTNVTFLPYQDSDVLPFSFASADFGIVSLGKGAEGLSVPSKTFYFLAAGAAIIAITGKGSEIDRLIINNSCGISVEPSDENKIKEFLKYCTELDLNLMKKAARNLSKNFSKENVKKFT